MQSGNRIVVSEITYSDMRFGTTGPKISPCAILVTKNTREFVRVQGLKLEDWVKQFRVNIVTELTDINAELTDSGLFDMPRFTTQRHIFQMNTIFWGFSTAFSTGMTDFRKQFRMNILQQRRRAAFTVVSSAFSTSFRLERQSLGSR